MAEQSGLSLKVGFELNWVVLKACFAHRVLGSVTCNTEEMVGSRLFQGTFDAKVSIFFLEVFSLK